MVQAWPMLFNALRLVPDMHDSLVTGLAFVSAQGSSMEHAKELATHVNPFPKERRGSTRFKLEVPLKIRCQTGEVVQGRTVEISESGISAIVPLGMIVGQSVELTFELPSGPISVQAVVRNNCAFRYGFQFIPEPHQQVVIKRGCCALAFG
jgi:hypothetical protein